MRRHFISSERSCSNVLGIVRACLADMEAAGGLRADVAQDPRLTISGCACDDTGQLMLSEYMDLKMCTQEVLFENNLLG